MLARTYSVPLVQLEQMSYGQLAREIAIFMAEHIRKRGYELAAPLTRDDPREVRAARRQEQRRLKDSDDWVDQLIYACYLNEKRRLAEAQPHD